MKYRKIGNSDLEVSVVALGTWVFGGDGWGSAIDAESVSAVNRAIDRGINFIDTAPVYGAGKSEEIIGHAIKGKRDKVIIATKCGLEVSGKSIRSNLSPAFIRKEIENSLRRLEVDTIDLYQCHWPDKNTPMEETFPELKKMVGEGKIRYVGVSNFDHTLLKEASEYAGIVSNQMEYSILKRDIEQDLIPLCKEKNISILGYGSLGGGILTGKYKEPPEFAKDDVRSFFYRFYREPVWSKTKKLLSVLEEIAIKHKVPVSNVAINWLLNHREIASSIAGCRNAGQVEDNIGAGDLELSDEEVAMIERSQREIFA